MTIDTFQKSKLLPKALAFQKFLKNTQKNWTTSLSSLESKSSWEIEHRPSSSHDSIIHHISNGDFIEKGAVNYSFVHAQASAQVAKAAKTPSLVGQYFVAMGISMIIHPKNPYVPTVHANLRYFQSLEENPSWWFSAVMDLTPTYGFDQDCIHWHQTCQHACQSANNQNHQQFKRACDQYYYLPHRKEHRGIGGLWIEQLNQPSFSQCQNLIESIGDHFAIAYVPICQRRHQMPYEQAQKDFQNYRRARYVEFNLLYDRGTQFGLSMGSRAESILVSMPPSANWVYDWKAKPGSPEEKLTQHYLQIQNWID